MAGCPGTPVFYPPVLGNASLQRKNFAPAPTRRVLPSDLNILTKDACCRLTQAVTLELLTSRDQGDRPNLSRGLDILPPGSESESANGGRR